MMDRRIFLKIHSVLVFCLLIAGSMTTFSFVMEGFSTENIYLMVGDGTEENPYVIEDVLDLQDMNDDLTAHYVLGKDIDASSTANWNQTDGVYKGFKPIGTFSDRFKGSFDGKGHEIKGLYINRNTTDRVGLFGYVDEGKIVKNVKLVDVDIIGDDYVGGLVGYNYRAHVMNSSVDGDLEGDKHIGGLVGVNYGFVRDCKAEVTTEGSERVGGLIGKNSRFVTESYTGGQVRGSLYSGGLIGFNSGTITNSHSSTDVGFGSHSGGLVGYNEDRISDCWATGNVEGDLYSAGLVGYNMNTGDISSCYANGDVTGNKTIGGLVGMNYNIIENCYATGDVTGAENVGGLVGLVDDVDEYHGGIVKRCYSIGTVSGNTAVGGLIGKNNHEVSYGFWDKETSGQQSSDGGTGMTTVEMKTKENYFDEGWDFSAVWNIISETSYPFFKYRYESPSISISGENLVEEDTQFTAYLEYEISSYPGQNEMTYNDITTDADWLTYEQEDQKFTGIPKNEDVGVYKIEVAVEDSVSGSTLTHFIEVKNVNDAPEITTNDVIEIVDGQSYSVQYNAIDIDPKVTTLDWGLDTDSDWLDMSEDGLLSGTPTWSDIGNYQVSVSVSDGDGGRDYSNFTLEVIALNDLSEIEIQGSHNVLEDEVYSISYSVSNSESDSLTWEINTTADWLEVDYDSQMIEGTPRNRDVGEYIINLKAENGEEYVVSRQFAVKVLNKNDEPEWIYTPLDQQIIKNNPLNIGCVATDADQEDVIEYSITGDTSSGIEIDSETGEIEWQNPEKGTYDLTVTASDGESSIDHDFSVDVIEISTEDQSSSENENTGSSDDSRESSLYGGNTLYITVIGILSLLLVISISAAYKFKKNNSEINELAEKDLESKNQ